MSSQVQALVSGGFWHPTHLEQHGNYHCTAFVVKNGLAAAGFGFLANSSAIEAKDGADENGHRTGGLP
jgi:hypothetical protein